MSVQAASQTIIENGEAGLARAVNRMVGGIIAYVRWPHSRGTAPRTLCLVGTPRLTGSIAPDMPGDGQVLVRQATAGGVMAAGDCDILFLGRTAEGDRRRLIEWVRGQPTLTITDDDPGCRKGAMFCLARKPAGLSFSVNLDAIGRGPLRVDPRVLRIGGAEGDGS